MPATIADTPAPADTGLTLSTAATRFEAMLGAEEKSAPPAPAQPKAAKEAKPDAEDANGLEADQADDETPPEDEEIPPEGEEGEEGAADGEQADAKPDPMDVLHTVKIDGKEEKVPLREVLAGYQRQADYSRKTAAVAQERNAVHGEKQQVQAERAQYAQLLEVLANQLQEGAAQEPDWQKLYDTSPLDYVRQKDLWRENHERRQAVQQEQARVQNLQEQESVAQIQAMVKNGREKLLEAIPAWKDKARWDTDRAKLREYGQTLGFSEEELGQAYDPRAVVALYKAMRYDNLMAQRPTPAQVNAPKVAKPGAPQTLPGKRGNDQVRAKQRLAQTGRLTDAAKVFEGLL